MPSASHASVRAPTGLLALILVRFLVFVLFSSDCRTPNPSKKTPKKILCSCHRLHCGSAPRHLRLEQRYGARQARRNCCCRRCTSVDAVASGRAPPNHGVERGAVVCREVPRPPSAAVVLSPDKDLPSEPGSERQAGDGPPRHPQRNCTHATRGSFQPRRERRDHDHHCHCHWAPTTG